MPTDHFTVKTNDRLTCVGITDRVNDAIPHCAEGTVTTFVEHTTCGLLVNEADSRLLTDFETFFGDVVADEGWAHDELDDNASAHLRAALLGPGVTIPVIDGELKLGTWQSVILVECDGPRRRSVRVTV